MDLIELHIIQSFPVTCLNRDDVGTPKTAYFGGCQRARISSQCWKRAVRLMAQDELPELNKGVRTRYVLSLFKDALVAEGLDEPAAENLAKETSKFFNDIDSKDQRRVKTALFLSPMEISDIAKALAEISKEKTPEQKDIKKICQRASRCDAADIAIFGRMVAGMFSHALSTHRCDNDIDFFAAVDEKTPEDTQGAAITGMLEFNSACYYRYVGLNLDMLADKDHLDHLSEGDRDQVIGTFLKAAILAVPNARKNSMFGFNPPAYVLGLRRAGQPLSLVNAFENPVKAKNGYIGESVDALRKHWEFLKELYKLEAEKTELPPDKLDEFLEKLV
jgi:CRISPR system Cascade subunit CasC